MSISKLLLNQYAMSNAARKNQSLAVDTFVAQVSMELTSPYYCSSTVRGTQAHHLRLLHQWSMKKKIIKYCSSKITSRTHFFRLKSSLKWRLFLLWVINIILFVLLRLWRFLCGLVVLFIWMFIIVIRLLLARSVLFPRLLGFFFRFLLRLTLSRLFLFLLFLLLFLFLFLFIRARCGIIIAAYAETSLFCLCCLLGLE